MSIRNTFCLWVTLGIVIHGLSAPVAAGQERSDSNGGEDVDRISSLFPRIEGSPGEKQLVEFLTDRLSVEGIQHTVHEIGDADLDHSFSVSIEATIPGKRPEVLLLAVPLNHPELAPAVLDGSINIAIALELLRRFRSSPPPISISVVFFGSEYGRYDRLGSSSFLRTFHTEHPTVVIYLEFGQIPDAVQVRTGANGTVSPQWLVNRTASAFNNVGLRFHIRFLEHLAARLGFSSPQTAIDVFLDAGIPSIGLEGTYGESAPHEEQSWRADFLRSLTILAEGFGTGYPTTWAQNYLFVHVDRNYVIVDERGSVLLFVLPLSMIVLCGLASSDRMPRSLKNAIRSFWGLSGLVLLTFGAFYAASGALSLILSLKDAPTVWTEQPLLFGGGKLVLALFVLAVTLRILRPLVFTPPRTDSSTPLTFVIVLNSIFIASIDLNVAVALSWIPVLGTLFGYLRNRIIKLAAFGLMTVGVAGALAVFVLHPERDLPLFLLFTPILGNVVWALAVLPVLIMFDHLRQEFPVLRRTAAPAIYLAALITVGSVVAALIFVFWPYSEEHPQPISAHAVFESFGARGRVDVSSPAPIDRLELQLAGRTSHIAVGARFHTVDLAEPIEMPQVLDAGISSTRIGGRRHFKLVLAPLETTPDEIELWIRSKDVIDVDDANFPIRSDHFATNHRILIGAHPPFPLSIEYSVPTAADHTVELALKFRVFPVRFVVTGQIKEVTTLLTVHGTITATTESLVE